MTEKVELKLQELKRIQSEEYYKKKDADLFAWGLTERDVSGKEVPVAITDEEYEELISAASSVNTVASRNSVAKALNIVAVCTIVVGFIIGFALMTFAESSKILYISVSMLISLLIAAMFWGLAEAIKLLQQLIDRKLPDRPAEAAKAPAQQSQVRQAYAQPQPQVQPQPQAQYQVTYTTATPPFVQMNPQQMAYQPVQIPQAQPQAQSQIPAGYQPVNAAAYQQMGYQVPPTVQR